MSVPPAIPAPPAAAATAGANAKPAKRHVAPQINAASYPTFTQAVLAFLRAEHARGWASFPPQDLGWRALKELWNVTPSHFDATILSFLQRKSATVQQHLLLAFATTNLTHVKNLSAFLSFTLHQLKEGPPVCLFYLAGCCPEGGHCEFQHPGPTPSWMTLYKRWGVTLQDFDYLVLNAVFQHTPAEQDLIMYRLARMKLKSIKNLSALLFSLIQQLEQQGGPKAVCDWVQSGLVRPQRPAPPAPQRKGPAAPRQRPPPRTAALVPPAAAEAGAEWPRAVSPATTALSSDSSLGESDGLSSDEAPCDGGELRGAWAGLPAGQPEWTPMAPTADYWPRMQALQQQLSALLRDAAETGLDLDMDLLREAAPTLGLPPVLAA